MGITVWWIKRSEHEKRAWQAVGALQMLVLMDVIRAGELKQLGLYFFSHEAATLNAPMPTGAISPKMLPEKLDSHYSLPKGREK